MNSTILFKIGFKYLHSFVYSVLLKEYKSMHCLNYTVFLVYVFKHFQTRQTWPQELPVGHRWLKKLISWFHTSSVLVVKCGPAFSLAGTLEGACSSSTCVLKIWTRLFKYVPPGVCGCTRTINLTNPVLVYPEWELWLLGSSRVCISACCKWSSCAGFTGPWPLLRTGSVWSQHFQI